VSSLKRRVELLEERSLSLRGAEGSLVLLAPFGDLSAEQRHEAEQAAAAGRRVLVVELVSPEDCA